MTEVGPLANPRLFVFIEGATVQLKWQMLFKTLASGEFSATTIEPYLEQLKPVSGFKVCPGIKEYLQEIWFETKNLRRWGIPFGRIHALSCSLWHIPNNTHHPTGESLQDTCQPCRVLHHDISKLVEKASSLTEAQKMARTSVQSKYPMKYLSPTSRAVRVSKVCKDRQNLAAKLSHVAHFDCDVSDKQHSELLDLVWSINKNGSKAINELCSEGEKILGVDNSPLRDVWHQDVVERLEYEKDQRKMGMLTASIVSDFDRFFFSFCCSHVHHSFCL